MPENKFSSFIFNLSHGVSLALATHIPASRRNKSRREIKVGFAEKKLRLQKTVGVSGLQPLHAGGMSLPVGGEGDGFAAFTVWGI